MSRILECSGFTWVPEITNPSYLMHDAMGVELESAELLYSLVRTIKPSLVIETGTYPGVGTEALLRGIQDNSSGMLYTYELRDDFLDNMRAKYASVDNISVIMGTPPTYKDAEFTFLDSEPNARREEFEKWVETAPPGAVLAFHDALVCDVGPALRAYEPKILIPVPRGLWIATKPR